MDAQLYYWRTNHGAEVDVLLCRGSRILCAIEIKSAQHIASEKLSGLRSFLKDNPDVPAYVLGKEQNRRLLRSHIEVMNWNDFIMEELALKVE